MKLRELLATVEGIESINIPDIDIQGLKTNSHACTVGDLFIGMPGSRVDGGEFWPGALAAGAVAAIVSSEAMQKNPPSPGSVVISADNMIKACAQIAATFYGYPGQKLTMVGVTGTNGKTTTTHLIEYFLIQANLPTALIGTLYTRWPGFAETAVNTTPFAVDLQQQLAKAINAGCQLGVMEVSSHALHQIGRAHV